MPEIGPMEILLVAIVALLVFGPEKLPDIARTVGRTVSQLRRTAQDMRDEFSSGLEDDSYDEIKTVDPDEDEEYVPETPDDDSVDRPEPGEQGPQEPSDDPDDEPDPDEAPVPEYPRVRKPGRKDA
jgi:Tat protein translocase TatB subunit